jgi:hypothetical protein
VPAPECDEFRALLTSLTVRVESIERRLSPSPLRREDQEALSRILPAIAGALGCEYFLASEAVASENPALILVLGGLNARRLGRLLRRGDGLEVDGYVVRASGTEGGAVLWSVVAGRTRESRCDVALPTFTRSTSAQRNDPP